MDDAERVAITLAVGISALDLGRFRKIPLSIALMAGSGYPQAQVFGTLNPNDVEWLREFVIDAIIKWQAAGFDPRVPEYFYDGFDRCMEQND